MFHTNIWRLQLGLLLPVRFFYHGWVTCTAVEEFLCWAFRVWFFKMVTSLLTSPLQDSSYQLHAAFSWRTGIWKYKEAFRGVLSSLLFYKVCCHRDSPLSVISYFNLSKFLEDAKLSLLLATSENSNLPFYHSSTSAQCVAMIPII